MKLEKQFNNLHRRRALVQTEYEVKQKTPDETKTLFISSESKEHRQSLATQKIIPFERQNIQSKPFINNRKYRKINKNYYSKDNNMKTQISR